MTPGAARERIRHLESRLSAVRAVRLHRVGVKNRGYGERWIDPSPMVEGIFELNPQRLAICRSEASDFPVSCRPEVRLPRAGEVHVR